MRGKMYDMTIRLQTDGGKRLYEQIYEHIRKEIREGKLLAGERLPSTRSLAEYLQVARSTVEYAYGQLVSEGYIESRPCRGYFVCSLDELFQMEAERMAPERLGEDCGKQGKGELEKDGTGEKEEEETCFRSGKGEIVCDFSPNGIDMTAFPFGVWKRISGNILNYGNSELFAQGEAQGDYDLRVTINRYLHSSRGVNCRPEQIVIGAGNDYLLLLLEKLLGRHIRIGMENPTYKRAYRIFQSFDYQIVTVDMDESGMQVSGLAKENVAAAYVMPSHQFPTGAVMPIGRRAELLNWASEQPGRYLIEDDYDSEFRYRGKPIPSLQASDEKGKVIYIGTFSKAIAPAIRVSYMVLPEALLERYRRQCWFYSCTVSRIDQRILNEFIRDGYFERHLNKMRKIYKGKQELLMDCLKPFRECFHISGEDAGLHLLLTARIKVSEEELTSAALDRGVKVYGISDSLMDKRQGKLPVGQRATVLLGFGGLDGRQIMEGTERLREAWLKDG